MNSNRDPMLAPGHDGMMLFDSTTDDSIAATDFLLDSTFPGPTDIMTDMFNSPQRSITSISSLKDVAPQPPQNPVPQAGSSPEDSDDSSSDDSAHHKRKSSSMSFQTDIDMTGDGSRYMAPAGTLLRPGASNHLPRAGFGGTFDHDVMNEAMANDFDFDSAASSPSPGKSLDGSNATSDQHCQSRGASYAGRTGLSQSPELLSNVKTESVLSGSPAMSDGRTSVATAPYGTFSTSSTTGPGRARVHIHPIPPKSRVETQIPIKLTINSLPEGIDKLHLPTHTISKPKFISRPTPEPAADMLELHSMLVCTSAMQDPVKRQRAFQRAAAKTRQMEAKEKETLPREEVQYAADDLSNPLNGGEVYICRGCITRERKRAARKKSKKPEEEAAWTSDEARRVVVFNTTEVRKWDEPEEEEPTSDERGRPAATFLAGAKQIKMPMRIACYCRHHAEKLGFQVIITLKDHQDQVIGQAMTDPIIITDDHKAQPIANAAAALTVTTTPVNQWPGAIEGGVMDKAQPQGMTSLSRNAFSSNDLTALQTMQVTTPIDPSGFSPFASTQASQYESAKSQRMNRSRQASPATSGGPAAKRRKANGGPKLPESLMMTKQNTNQHSTAPPNASAGNGSSTSSVPMSAISPFGFTFPTSIAQVTNGQQQRAPSFPSGPPTPDSGTNDFWANNVRAQSFDRGAQSQPMFSASSSRIQSRAPSPTGPAIQSTQSMAPRSAQAYNVAGPQTQGFPRAPVINKIVPAEGPIAGGIEVTCLGSGFFNGLEVVFGNSPATTTTYWGETTLVCLLPPADRPGVVPVTFKHMHENFASALRTTGKQSFMYVDEEEQDLFRQAFIALSQKMNGSQSIDPTDFARQTLGGRDGGSSWPSYGAGAGHYRQRSAASAGAITEDTEATVLRCLELIDMDEGPCRADLDFQRNNGQTMLHLAASLGFQRLVAALLARGCDPDLPDRNGFSPLHMASLRNHVQVVRRLRFAGANPMLQSRLGYTPAQLTTDSLVLQMLDSSPRLRSRSFGAASLHSRGNSMSSFALATPPRSRATSMSRFDLQDEYDTSSGEEDDEMEPMTLARTRSWHQSRRNSAALPDLSLQKTAPLSELNESLTPAAAMVAWRDQLAAQIQHFQQTVEGMLPHLQMPTLPTIPPLTGMPNYQAPAMVRRFSSLVPQISSRPASPTGSTGSSKDGDSRWWGYFTGSQATPSTQPTLPPSYDDIYPEDTDRGLDDKARSIAATQARNAKMQEVTTTPVESAEGSASTVIDKGSLATEVHEASKTPQLAQAVQPKHLRNDRKLWFFWLPALLVLVLITLGYRLPAGWMPTWNMKDTAVGDVNARVVEV